MSIELQYYIDNMALNFGYGSSDILTARNYLFYAGEYLQDNEFSLAGAALVSASNYFGYAISHWNATPPWGSSFRTYFVDALEYINENLEGGGGDVTMDQIINAMLGATKEQYTPFIGIVDAYRVALMDQWFNAEYYAALARGFKT